jgi:hypothetical protein
MVAMADGSQGAEDEYCPRFASAGFQLTTTVPTSAGPSAIEGVIA